MSKKTLGRAQINPDNQTPGSLWTWGAVDSSYASSPVQLGTGTNWINSTYDSKYVIGQDRTVHSFTNQSTSAQVGSAVAGMPYVVPYGTTYFGIDSGGKMYQWGTVLPLFGTYDDPLWTFPIDEITVDSSNYYARTVIISGGWIGITQPTNSNAAPPHWIGAGYSPAGNGSPVATSFTILSALGNNWKSVRVTQGTAVGLKNDNTLWAWGPNPNGIITPLQSTADADVWKVVSGTALGGMGIKTNGTLWAWGNYIGAASTADSQAKRPIVQIGTDSNWNNIECITSTLRRAFISKTDNSLWAMGVMPSTLGIGSTNYSQDESYGPFPTQIVAPSAFSWTQVSAGTAVSIAVRGDGTLYTIGGYYGAPYIPNTPSGPAGQPVGSGVVQIASNKTWSRAAVSGFSGNFGYGTIAAIAADGTLWTWGYNNAGQAANGTTSNAPFAQVGADTNWASVYNFASSMLALKADGTAWAWGSDVGSTSPIQVMAGTTFTKISANSDYSSGIHPTLRSTSGDWYSWYQSGNSWTLVPSTSTFSHVGMLTSYYGFIGLDSSSKLVVRGGTGAGTCTHGARLDADQWLYPNISNVFVSTPVQVASNVAEFVHAGTTIIYRGINGAIYTKGYDQYGLTGQNNTSLKISPFTQLGSSFNWTSIGGNGNSVWGTVDGAIYGWGSSYNFVSASASSPVQIGTNTIYNKVFATGARTFFNDVTGGFWGMGSNYYYQLGYSATTSTVSTPVALPGVSNVVSVGSNNEFSLAVDNTGVVYRAGYTNALFNAGSYTYPWTSTVTLVPSIKFDSYNNSGIWGVDTSTQKAYFWGVSSQYSSRQLWMSGNSSFYTTGEGIPFNNASSLIAPRLVNQSTINSKKWKFITSTQVGGSSVAAIATDGTLWMWGYNSGHAFGLNASNVAYSQNTNFTSPVRITDKSNFSKVHLGYGYTMAIDTQGVLWGWGYKSGDGYLGGKVGQPSSSPSIVNSTHVWNDVAFNDFGGVGVTSTGSVYRWGWPVVSGAAPEITMRNFGFVYDGSGYPYSGIAAVGTDNKLYRFGNNNGLTWVVKDSNPVWKKISSGFTHSLLLKTDGTLWSMGAGQWGELGYTRGVSFNSVSASDNRSFMAVVTSAGSAYIKNLSTWASVGSGYLNARMNRSQAVAVTSGGAIRYLTTAGGTIDPAVPGTSWVAAYTNSNGTGSTASYVALDNTNTLFGWGGNAYGEVGGTSGIAVSPTTPNALGVNVSRVAYFGQPSAGTFASGCTLIYIKQDNTAWILGSAVGYSSTSSYSGTLTTPTQIIAQDGTSTWRDFAPTLSSDLSYTGMFAVSTNGELYYFGYVSTYGGGLGVRLAFSAIDGVLNGGSYGQIRMPVKLNNIIANNIQRITVTTDDIIAINTSGQLWSYFTSPDGSLTSWRLVPSQSNYSSFEIATASNTWEKGGIIYVKRTDSLVEFYTSDPWASLVPNSSPYAGGISYPMQSPAAGENLGTYIVYPSIRGNIQNPNLFSPSLLLGFSSSPVQVGTDTNWSDIEAGNGYSIGLKTDGSLWQWGSIGVGHSMRSTDTMYHPVASAYQSPVKIGTSSWTMIRAGTGSAVARTIAGVWHAWGSLFQYDSNYLSSPVMLGSKHLIDQQYDDVVNDGYLFAEGSVAGDGAGIYYAPIAVAYNGTPPRKINPSNPLGGTGVTVAGYFAVGNGGRVFKSSNNSLYTPAFLNTFYQVHKTLADNVNIHSTTSWINVGAGYPDMFVGVTTTNEMWFTGRYLHNGTYWENKRAPASWGAWKNVGLAPNGTYQTTVYGIKTDGTLWAWGYNGSLGVCGVGNNTTGTFSSPMQIGASTNWTSIISQTGSLTMMFMNSLGQLWSLGSNTYGEIGNNTTLPQSSPVQVPGSWTMVSASSASTNTRLGIKTDGTLWIWGSTSDGVVGDNIASLRYYSSPVQIGTSTWRSVANSGSTVAAAKTDGTLWVWGSTSGFGLASTYYSSPVQISATGFTNAQQVSFMHGGLQIIANGGEWWVAGAPASIGYPATLHGSTITSGSGTVLVGPNATKTALTFARVGTRNNWSKFVPGGVMRADGSVWNWNIVGPSHRDARTNTTATTRAQSLVRLIFPGKDHAYGTWVLDDGSANTPKQWIKWAGHIGLDTEGRVWTYFITQQATDMSVRLLNTTYTYTDIGCSGWSTTSYRVAALRTTGEIDVWTGYMNSGNATSATLDSGTNYTGAKFIGPQGENAIYFVTAAGDIRRCNSSTSTLIFSGSSVLAGRTWARIFTMYYNPNYVLAAIASDGECYLENGGSAGWASVGKSFVSQASKRSQHMGLVDSEGRLYEWGWNASISGSSLPTFTPVKMGAFDSPVPLLGAVDWSMICPVENSFLAIQTNGTLWAWGRPRSGNLGLSTAVDSTPVPSPTMVGGSWAMVASLNSRTYGIDNNGSMWAWGAAGISLPGFVGGKWSTQRSHTVVINRYSTWGSEGVIATDDNNVPYFVNASYTSGTNVYDYTTLSRPLMIASDSGRTYESWVFGSPTIVNAKTGKSVYTISSYGSAGTYMMYLLDTNNVLWSWGIDRYGVTGTSQTLYINQSPSQVTTGVKKVFDPFGGYRVTVLK